MALIVVSPAAALTLLAGLRPVYTFFAQSFALVPGLPGSYLRAAYYKLTLRECSIDVTLAFGTYFVQPDTSGRAVRFDRQLLRNRAVRPSALVRQIASHVLIPSGRRQHVRNSDGSLSDYRQRSHRHRRGLLDRRWRHRHGRSGRKRYGGSRVGRDEAGAAAVCRRRQSGTASAEGARRTMPHLRPFAAATHDAVLITGPVSTELNQSRSLAIPVLITVRELDQGGVERDVAKIATHLDRERFDPHVMAFWAHGFRYDELRAAGVPVIEIPVRSLTSIETLRLAAELRRYIKQHGFQVVHSYDASYVFACTVARLSGVPVTIGSSA